MDLDVYLSGEIHTDWREKIIEGCKANNLSISFSSAVTNHEASDGAGDLLGAEEKNFWRDHKSAKVNAIRTKTLIESCDVAIVRFGEKYKQWNAAFDAGYCAALGTPYITLHNEDIIHPLKEVDAAALAWATTPEQVVEILKYVVSTK
ncbi:MAG: YtoQ family protein [Pseudomonadales bacterium]|nr:YtoQ family protein [Pseudomonadales bacterium]